MDNNQPIGDAISPKKGSFGKMADKLKCNPWILGTLVFGVIAIVLLLPFFGITGNSVSEKDAGQKIADFVKLRGYEAEVLNVDNYGSGLYAVNISINGQEDLIYVTSDGKNLVGTVIPLVEDSSDLTSDSGADATPKEVPKSDKPTLDVFVFSHCPYGTQIEKAVLPFYKTFKNKVDINLVFIGAMHGEYEKQESLRQLCIQDGYGKDKLWNYLEKFLGDTAIGACNGNEVCINPLVEKIFTQVGIDKNKINACMTKDAEALYNKDLAKASALGISGSPTIVLNGVEASLSNRSPAGVQELVCSAFNTAPSECSATTLSANAASPGFGFVTGAATSSASCG